MGGSPSVARIATPDGDDRRRAQPPMEGRQGCQDRRSAGPGTDAAVRHARRLSAPPAAQGAAVRGVPSSRARVPPAVRLNGEGPVRRPGGALTYPIAGWGTARPVAYRAGVYGPRVYGSGSVLPSSCSSYPPLSRRCGEHPRCASPCRVLSIHEPGTPSSPGKNFFGESRRFFG
jgi:hypothetical protein